MDFSTDDFDFKKWGLVHFEANEIVRNWRSCGEGRDDTPVPFEELALATLAKAQLHLRGPAHAEEVARVLRARAWVEARRRAEQFIEERLRGGDPA